MKAKIISLTILVSLLLVTFAMFPVKGAWEDKPQDLLIRMYLNPDAEFYALDTGEIDVVDWPISKDWIDTWLGSSDIRMVDYSEMAWNELTFNHQLWPTGWRNYTENPTITLGGDLQPYDPTIQRCVDATYFRKAIVCLHDKAKYISEVLKGYGVSTDASKPATVGWINPGLAAIVYSQAKAIANLTAGAFIDYDEDGWLEYSPGHLADPPGPTGPADMEELPPIEFYARLDDPYRGDPADMLRAEMEAVGIKCTAAAGYHKVLAWPCYLAVMFGCAAGEPLPAYWPDVSSWLPGGQWMEGMKRFHFYTSGWISTSPTQDQFHDLYVAAMATEADGMFSTNYGGFCVGDGTPGTADDAYDYEYYADIAKFGIEEGDGVAPILPSEVKDGVFKCQELAQKFWPVVPWFSLVSVKAYRHTTVGTFEWMYEPGVDDSGWFGAVNHGNLGVDFAASNAFAFVNMENPGDATLDWGFKTEPFTLNTVTQQWLYESNVLGLIYEPMILHTPWDLTVQYPWLAEPRGPGPDGVMGSSTNAGAYYDDVWADTEVWYDPDGSTSLDPPVYTGDERMALTMTLREGLTFHNGDPVTPEDVKFNCIFQRDSGSGVSYGWPTYALMEYIDTHADDSSLGENEIKWYFGISTFWLLYYAGYTGPIDTNIWMAANDNYGWGYNWVDRGSGFILDAWNATGHTYLNVTAHPGNPCNIAVDESVYIVSNPEDPTVNVGPFNVESKTASGGGTYVFELDTTVYKGDVPVGSRLDELPGDGTGWNSMLVIAYQPWLADQDTDGTVDLAEDGTGPWIFDNWNVGNSILLTRNNNYHKTQASDEIAAYLIESFHRAGNVNYEGAMYESEYDTTGDTADMSIRMGADGMRLARSVGMKSIHTHGTGYNMYNVDTDFNRNGWVWTEDYIIKFGKNYGKDAG